ncbi:MAG: PAS domain S-box protein, partial [Deltaproteobacteria bacterium]|nr:PAS domain S-box protein [Deltaproteobacteria bacterium]
RDVTERRKAERDLRETKAFLDNIIESSQDCIVVSDTKGNLTRVNKYFLELLGYKEEEVVGKHITEFTPLKEGIYESSTGASVEINKEFFDRSYSMVTALIEAGKITNRETYFLTKDKKVIPTEENIVYLYNDAGKRIGAVGILRDITVRKQAEEKLKETMEFLDNVLESIQDCVVVTDVKGYYKRVNKYFLELLGYEEEEILGKHISEFTPLAEGSYESITGELVKINGEFFDRVKFMVSEFIDKGKISNWDSYFVRKDKKLVFVEERMVYLYDSVGERIGAVGIIRDVTERKKAEKEIMEARDFLENIFKTSVDGIMTTDYKGNITMVNRAVEEILGHSKDELVGKHTTELGPKRGDYKERVKESFATIMEKGFISEFEYTWLKKDGKEVDIELNAAMLRDSKGEFAGVVSSVRDITKRMKTEKRLNDYQNQLRSLTSQLTLTEERARRRIATDLHDRIGQALAMSKIKLGSLRESASSIGLDGDVDKIRDLIEQTIQDTRSLIFDICPPLLYELGFEKAVEWLLENIQEQHGINVLFEDDGIPKPLDDDIRVLLYQTVRELLMNVVKHAQAKKVMVSFKGNRGHVKISVEDDGIGFDPSKISSREGKPEGFGLFRIVERLHYLGGEIQFESKPHHGTKISMVVPTEQSGQTRKEEVK